MWQYAIVKSKPMYPTDKKQRAHNNVDNMPQPITALSLDYSAFIRKPGLSFDPTAGLQSTAELSPDDRAFTQD